MTKSETVVKLHGRQCGCKELDECTIIMIKKNPLVSGISMAVIQRYQHVYQMSDLAWKGQLSQWPARCFSSIRTCSDSVSLTILEQVHVQVNWKRSIFLSSASKVDQYTPENCQSPTPWWTIVHRSLEAFWSKMLKARTKENQFYSAITRTEYGMRTNGIEC